MRRALAFFIGQPLILPDAVTLRFPQLADASWRLGGLGPRIGGWALGQRSVDGITLGRTVFLAPHALPSAALLLHEFAHVLQFERDPVFPLRYLWESVRRGYHGNRYEIEANAYSASELSRLHQGA